MGSVGKPFDSGDAGSPPHPHHSRPNSTFYVGVDVIPEEEEPQPQAPSLSVTNSPEKRLPIFPKHSPMCGRSISLDETRSGASFDTLTPPHNPSANPQVFNFSVTSPEGVDVLSSDSVDGSSSPGPVTTMEVTPVIHVASDSVSAHFTSTPSNDAIGAQNGNTNSEGNSKGQQNTHKRLRRLGVTKQPNVDLPSNTDPKKLKTRTHRSAAQTKSLPANIVLGKTTAQLINNNSVNSDSEDSVDDDDGLPETISDMTSSSQLPKEASQDSDPSENANKKEKESLSENNRDIQPDTSNKNDVDHSTSNDISRSSVSKTSTCDTQQVDTEHTQQSNNQSKGVLNSISGSDSARSSNSQDQPQESSSSGNSCVEESEHASTSEDSTENPSLALLNDVNANSLKSDQMEAGVPVIDPDARYRADSIDAPDVPFFHERLSTKQSEGAADNVSLFRHYLEDVNTVTTEPKEETPAAKPKNQSPDVDMVSISC